MKIMNIGKSDIENIVLECLNIITENRESKNMKMARNVVKQYNQNADAMYIITQIRNAIPNSRLEDCKFLPGVTRMFMAGEINGNENKINNVLKLISNGHSNEYDNYLNNETADTIIQRFSNDVKTELERDKQLHNNTEFIENSDYTIVKITSSREASKYRRYCDWCITSVEPVEEDEDVQYDDETGTFYNEDGEDVDIMTMGEDMYNNYTNNGLGVFYFCLRNGFENEQRVVGENCPLDSYGLSMIATSVDEDGRCNTITCRWNHANNGNDSIMTPIELSKLIGRNYYEVFKPYTKEELYEMGKIPFGDVDELLSKGMDIKKLFKGITKTSESNIYKVSLNGKYNLYNSSRNRLISNQWFNGCDRDFSDGLMCVYDKSENLNFIRTDGSFLFDKFIDARSDGFYKGFAIVRVYNNKNTEARIITPNGETINTNYNIRGSKVYNQVGNFISTEYYGSYYLYYLNGEPVLKNSDGVTHGYDSIDFNNNGYVSCTLRRHTTIIDKDGNVVLDVNGSAYMKDYLIFAFEGGVFSIYTYDGNKYIDVNFDYIHYNGFDEWSVVSKDKKENYFNFKEKKFLFKNWYKRIINVKDSDKYFVYDSEKYYLIDSNENMLFDTNFDDVTSTKIQGTFIVKKGGKSNIIDKDNNMLDKWFDTIYPLKFNTNLKGYDRYKCYIINPETLKYREQTQKDIDDEMEINDLLRDRY